MLHTTFQRLFFRVSPKREAAFWKQGIYTWEDLERHLNPQGNLFTNDYDPGQNHLLTKARSALTAKDASYFASLLNRREYYRIPLSFPEKTLFLDIETTGLSRYYDVITLVGWSYQGKYNTFCKSSKQFGQMVA